MYSVSGKNLARFTKGWPPKGTHARAAEHGTTTHARRRDHHRHHLRLPGETDDDFAATLEVVAAASYDDAYTFIFSPREGTEAAAMGGSFVASDVAADRFARLRTVVERSALARHEARVGRVEEVLVSGPSKRNPSMLSARTRQHKLIHVPAAPGLRPGTYAMAEVTSAAPHFLRGEVRDIVAAPAHKVRIPLGEALVGTR